MPPCGRTRLRIMIGEHGSTAGPSSRDMIWNKLRTLLWDWPRVGLCSGQLVICLSTLGRRLDGPVEELAWALRVAPG